MYIMREMTWGGRPALNTLGSDYIEPVKVLFVFALGSLQGSEERYLREREPSAYYPASSTMSVPSRNPWYLIPPWPLQRTQIYAPTE